MKYHFSLTLFLGIISSIYFLSFAHDTGSNQHTLLPKITKSIEYKEIDNDLGDIPLIFTRSQKANQRWLKSEDIADFCDIKSIKYVTVPIVLNIVFIGFEGNGQHGFVMHDDDLQLWFEHIEHQFDINRLIHLDHKESSHFSLKYSVSLRLIKLSPLVNIVIENAILKGMRSDVPDGYDEEYENENHSLDNHDKEEYQDHYVDVFKFTSLLKDLEYNLGLNNTYSLFIMNPKNPFKDSTERYGYRIGFSKEEIKILYKSKEYKINEIEKLISQHKVKNITENISQQEFYNKNDNKNIPEVEIVDLSAQSEKWANDKIKKYLKKDGYVEYKKNCLKEDDPLCGMGLDHNYKSIIKYAQYIAKNGDINQKLYLHKVQNEENIQEECLIDHWLSHDRFGFIDLTAGPFEWGNLLSDGYKTKQYLPQVPNADIITIPQEKGKKDQTNGHSSFEEREEWENWKEVQEFFLNNLEKEYMAECLNKGNNEKCKILKERNDAIRSNIHDIIGNVNEQENIINNPGLTYVDDFMSRISSVVYRTINSLIARQIPYNVPRYTKRVLFNFYHIKMTDKLDYDPFKHFNIEDFKEEIFKMKLPNQAFEFNFFSVKETTNHYIKKILEGSIRESKYERINGNKIIKKKILSLDKNKLITDLNLYSIGGLLDSNSNFTFKAVPILFISFNHKIPVLFDKNDLAITTDNAVLVVQSNTEKWNSHISCNKDDIVWDLRNPISQALQATALYYGGLIPTHSIYDEANIKLHYDYFWSVGDSPMSISYGSHHFSQFHLDIIHRNLLITALEYNIKKLNHGIHTLKHIKTSLMIWDIFEHLQLEEIKKTYDQIIRTIEEIRIEIYNFQFSFAFAKLDRLNSLIDHFEHKSHELNDLTILHQCIYMEPENIYNWIVPITILVDIILILIYWNIKDRTKKLKDM